MTKKNGFTLVELIVVILILGITTSYAASRYFGKSSFSAYTYQEAVVSVVRQVQVNRMQSNISGASSSIILEVSSDCVGSVEACALPGDEDGIEEEQKWYQRSDVVRDTDVSFSLFDIGSSTAYSPVEFSLLGSPIGDANDGFGINVTANGVTARVCINAQGYVYKDC